MPRSQAAKQVGISELFGVDWLSFSDKRNGNPHPFWMYGEFRALPCGWVLGEPLSPLFIHPCEVGLLAQNPGCANRFVERAACCAQDRFDIPETLTRLFLNGCSNHFASFGVERSLSRNKDKPASLHSLAISRQGFWRFFCVYDLFCHS
jgi:hypothetical protein